MTPPVDIRPPAHRGAGHSTRVARAGVVGLVSVAAAVVLLMMSVVFRDPEFVVRVRIDNPSDYDIHIDLAEPGAQTRLPLGVVGQQCNAVFEDVIDPGATWVVRFSTQARDAGEITVARSELEHANWTVRVPDDVVQRLALANAPLSPRHGCAPA